MQVESLRDKRSNRVRAERSGLRLDLKMPGWFPQPRGHNMTVVSVYGDSSGLRVMDMSYVYFGGGAEKRAFDIEERAALALMQRRCSTT